MEKFPPLASRLTILPNGNNATAVDRVLHAAEEKYREINFDQLTGLLNKTAFDEKLNELIDSNVPFALVQLDMDDFKKINQQGQAFGDLKLIDVADIIRSLVRHPNEQVQDDSRVPDYVGINIADNFASRRSGDEFNIALTGIESEDTLLAVLGRLQDAFKQQGLNISAGATIYTNGDTAETLRYRAEQAVDVEKNRKLDDISDKEMDAVIETLRMLDRTRVSSRALKRHLDRIEFESATK